jgi:nucleoside 2-deoxyribosyltransferase
LKDTASAFTGELSISSTTGVFSNMASTTHNATLNVHTTAPTPSHPAPDNPPRSYSYYHAGPLFTLAELTSNINLARAITSTSNHKFNATVPQDLEQRDTTPHAIRDADIRALLSCDLALFTYDGAELDSGTVVEYMFAKFADIPTVILRTDFRGAGDQGGEGDKWNLMSSFYPRTKGVVVDSMGVYKAGLALALDQGTKESEAGVQAGNYVTRKTAEMVVKAMDEVVSMESVMPKVLRPKVYEWLALMPGFKSEGDEGNMRSMMELLMRKEDRGLL